MAFFSQKLSAAQSCYSAFDRELLAAVSSIRHFFCQLEGHQFHLLMDHKPLTFALKWLSDPWTTRQTSSQADGQAYIAEYKPGLIFKNTKPVIFFLGTVKPFGKLPVQ